MNRTLLAALTFVALVLPLASPVVSADPDSSPGAPWGLVAIPLVDESANQAILLSWQPPANDGGSLILEYRVYRSTGDAPVVQIGVAPDTGYVDDQLAAEPELIQLVSYFVTAVNADGESQPSASASMAQVGTTCIYTEDDPPFIWIDPNCLPP